MLVELQLAMLVELENTTIKLERLIVKLVELENTTIKRNAQQSLIAKIVKVKNTMIKLERLIVKLARLVKNQQVIKKSVFSLVHRPWYTPNGRVRDASSVRVPTVGGTSRRRQRARRELVRLDGVTWRRRS